MEHGERRSRRLTGAYLAAAAWVALTACFLFFVFRHVDVKPRVEQNFFFSSHDPLLQADRLISKTFLQEPQLILAARGDIHSPLYLEKVRVLTEALSALPGIAAVESLARGPRDVDTALKNPLWKRVLFSEDRRASFVYVWIKRQEPVEKALREIQNTSHRLSSPDFPLMIGGAPYIIEVIQRNLLRDLRVFTIAAFCVFGLSGLILSRSVPMVVGTLVTCTNAGAVTLILTQRLGIPLGPLTANLSTIVFVLTLTHMVFTTFNWRHIIRETGTGGGEAWRRAVKVTLLPSFWSMLTALMGFFEPHNRPCGAAAPARPVRGDRNGDRLRLRVHHIPLLSQDPEAGFLRRKEDGAGLRGKAAIFRGEARPDRGAYPARRARRLDGPAKARHGAQPFLVFQERE